MAKVVSNLVLASITGSSTKSFLMIRNHKANLIQLLAYLLVDEMTITNITNIHPRLPCSALIQLSPANILSKQVVTKKLVGCE